MGTFVEFLQEQNNSCEQDILIWLCSRNQASRNNLIMPIGQSDQAGGDVMAVVSAVSHGFSLLCGPFSLFLSLLLSLSSSLSLHHLPPFHSGFPSPPLFHFFLSLLLIFYFSALPLSVYPIPISVPAFSLYSDYLNRLTSLPKHRPILTKSHKLERLQRHSRLNITVNQNCHIVANPSIYLSIIFQTICIY